MESDRGRWNVTQSSYPQCKMTLSKIHSSSKPFGSKPFFVFSLVYRCALCVMMTRLIYQPTNSVSEVSVNPCQAQFTKQIQMHLHAHLSVCLSSKQKLAITEWGRSNSQFLLHNALGSNFRRSLSEILVYVQKKPSSEMYKIHVANKLLVYPPLLHRFREFAEKERER